MKQWIYEKGTVIGSFEVKPNGLYDEYTCEVHAIGKEIRRLYAVSGFSSRYLGIPDAQGKLKKMLNRKLLPREAGCIVSSAAAKDLWSPWRGSLDGVKVEDCLLRQSEGQLLFALLPEEALEFPAWTDHFSEETIQNQTRMLIRLTPDGQLSAIERKNRRDRDEEDENSVGFTDPQLCPDDAPATGECPGDQGEGRQADCPDL